MEPEPQMLREKPGLCMDPNHYLSGAPSPPLQAVLFEWLIASALIQSLELHQKAGKSKEMENKSSRSVSFLMDRAKLRLWEG